MRHSACISPEPPSLPFANTRVSPPLPVVYKPPRNRLSPLHHRSFSTALFSEPESSPPTTSSPRSFFPSSFALFLKPCLRPRKYKARFLEVLLNQRRIPILLVPTLIPISPLISQDPMLPNPLQAPLNLKRISPLRLSARNLWKN